VGRLAMAGNRSVRFTVCGSCDPRDLCGPPTAGRELGHKDGWNWEWRVSTIGAVGRMCMLCERRRGGAIDGCPEMGEQGYGVGVRGSWSHGFVVGCVEVILGGRCSACRVAGGGRSAFGVAGL
jgi:hypothetical protein